MWLEAILTREDLQGVAEKFSPLKLLLGDSGTLLLLAPEEVSLIADKGIVVKCDATLHWPVLGFEVPVSMRGLLVHVLPSVEERPDGATLVFRLQIDHAGVAMLPSFFDHTVTARVNQALTEKGVELAWNFVKTLSHVFGLPASFASAAGLSLKATAGRVKTTETALGLAVDFEASVRPRDGDASANATSEATEDASKGDDQTATAGGANPARVSPARRGPFDSRSFAVGAAAAWLLLTGTRAVFGAGKPRPKWRLRHG
jgi:hypothetical protein